MRRGLPSGRRSWPRTAGTQIRFSWREARLRFFSRVPRANARLGRELQIASDGVQSGRRRRQQRRDARSRVGVRRVAGPRGGDDARFGARGDVSGGRRGRRRGSGTLPAAVRGAVRLGLRGDLRAELRGVDARAPPRGPRRGRRARGVRGGRPHGQVRRGVVRGEVRGRALRRGRARGVPDRRDATRRCAPRVVFERRPTRRRSRWLRRSRWQPRRHGSNGRLRRSSRSLRANPPVLARLVRPVPLAVSSRADVGVSPHPSAAAARRAVRGLVGERPRGRRRRRPRRVRRDR